MPELPECFVVMPISDPDGYQPGHFGRVFSDLVAPACERAGFHAIRADDIRETNLIHLDVLQRLLDSAMVLCDLSSRNPNVLFELGLRQAFDKPVVLIQEVGTPKIFDIAPLRFTEYRPARIYHEVIEDQEKIASAVAATRDAFSKGSGVNSIVRILALTRPASLPEVNDANRDPALQLVRAELSELRNELRRLVRPGGVTKPVLEIEARDAIRAFSEALETVADPADLTAVPLVDLKTLRDRAADAFVQYREAGGPSRLSIRSEFERAEVRWQQLLDRVSTKDERTG